MNGGLETPTPGECPACVVEGSKVWRVGWLAHDPLRGRCPRAAPNPFFEHYGTSSRSSMGHQTQRTEYQGRSTRCACEGPRHRYNPLICNVLPARLDETESTRTALGTAHRSFRRRFCRAVHDANQRLPKTLQLVAAHFHCRLLTAVVGKQPQVAYSCCSSSRHRKRLALCGLLLVVDLAEIESGALPSKAFHLRDL
jgi:hypothetical protein